MDRIYASCLIWFVFSPPIFLFLLDNRIIYAHCGKTCLTLFLSFFSLSNVTVSSERKPQVTSLPSWSKHGQLPKLGCHDNIWKGGVLREKERERVAACSCATEHERQKQLNGDRHLDRIWCPSGGSIQYVRPEAWRWQTIHKLQICQYKWLSNE